MKQGKRVKRPGFLRRMVRFVMWCMGLGVLAALSVAAWVVVTAPPLNLNDIAPDGYRTTVLDDSGTEILTLAGEASNRVYVTVDQMPQHLKDAFVAIEDERFYTHPGIDPRGILRAAWSSLSGRGLQGASTITQQLIKNNVFTSWMDEQTLLDKARRKLQEQYLALLLEQKVTKEWILENYMNTINLGGGTWGVQTAAQRYFGKDAADLSLAESAVIAAIPQSPTGYNPLKHPEASRSRQLLVLGKLLSLGMIDQAAHDTAVAEDVYEKLGKTAAAGYSQEIFSYFEDTMIQQVMDDLTGQLGYSEEDAWRLLYRGGLTVCTTQDTALQRLCEETVNDSSWYTGDEQATVVVMDHSTGQIKAIVGGRGEKTGSLTLNRATSSLRQPGSTLKVVGEYAAILDGGAATLGTVYNDAPCTYSNGTAIRNAGGTYAGRMTVRRAITRSVNTVALQCFQQAGIDTVWAYLQAFGFESLTEADKVEALALGGTHGGVTNLEMTAAYSAIANGGEYIEPTCYTRILDRQGNVLLEKESVRRTVVQPGTAALLTEAMTDVMSDGTGILASFSGVPLAGKSGTTTDMRDTWFVGYSPLYTCGVWGGHDDYSEQSSNAYVKKIWRTIMEGAHQETAFRDFSAETQLTEAEICSKCGQLAVEGLCDVTVQGDMTYTEYFIPGTEPTEDCTCHVRITLCLDSGMLCSPHCPNLSRQEIVYLREGTAETADAEAVLSRSLQQETCSVHRYWWSWLFPSFGNIGGGLQTDPPGEEAVEESEEEDNDRYYNWIPWSGSGAPPAPRLP